MATSTCAKCGNHAFEISNPSFTHSTYKLLFVQCSSCGAVVGITDSTNISMVLEEQNRAIKRINDKLDELLELHQD